MDASEKNLQYLTEGMWQWKSNSNSWSGSEEPQWQSYSPEHNLLLEKAYFDHQKEVVIGDWIVSLEHMLQIDKEDKALQRPIRRIDWIGDEFSSSRSTRYCNEESPKPFNKVFGNLEDFINFLSKRSPEIFGFAKLFEEIQGSNNVDELNKKICPDIRNCIIKEFCKLSPEKPNDVLSSSSLKKTIQSKERQNREKLIQSFKGSFESFEDFFAKVVRVYTMDTFLYRNLNKYLRDENWADLHDLSPYAFCLCKAFFKKKLSKIEEAVESPFITLYRGTVLSSKTIQCFDALTFEDFSWYSVISTTKRREIVEKFITETDQDQKSPVIFVIEVPKSLGYLDVSEYSVFPEEEEVLLPPGSLFKMRERSVENSISIVTLELRNLENPPGRFIDDYGSIIPGALQSQMMNDREIKIVCLEGEELYDALKGIYENTLIEEVEFYMCTFDNKSLGEMLKVLPTLKRAKIIKFVLCLSQDEGEILSKMSKRPDFSTFTIQIYEVQNLYKIFGISKHWVSLKSLSLIFKKITDQGLSSLCSQALQHLCNLTSLNLDLSNCLEITDEGINNLSSGGLKYLTKLEDLNMNFSSCSKITIKGIRSLFFGGLKHLSNLNSLNLDFSFCDQLTEKVIDDICYGCLQHLNDLKVYVKAHRSFLKQFVSTVQRIFNLISEDGQIANQPIQKSQSDFKKVIADLLLEADLKSKEKEVPISYQDSRDRFVFTENDDFQVDNGLQNLKWRSEIIFKNSKSLYPQGSEVLITDDCLYIVPKDFPLHKFTLESLRLQIIIGLTPQFLNFKELFNKLDEKKKNLSCKESCFAPLNLFRCPFWMRDKTFDSLILEELEHHIQQTSKDFGCSETIIEILFKTWFERLSFEISKGFFFVFDNFVDSTTHIYLEAKRKGKICRNQQLKTKSFFSKNSNCIRFPKKAQRVSIRRKQRIGYPFS